MRNDSIAILKKTAENHITELEEKLKKIYTIDIPEEIKKTNNKNVDIRIRLEVFSKYEEIYKVIEGNPQGEIYEIYQKYLLNVKNTIDYLEKEKKKIEEANKNDIENANKLIAEFSKFLD
ncbi:hypothetical protein ABE042_04710 [Viridibacillus arvi]|uniref:hypothetical protein n=1 Tax=Viridibacillus arvi TaxID=263475 RepID=UPI003D2A1E90